MRHRKSRTKSQLYHETKFSGRIAKRALELEIYFRKNSRK